MRGKAFGTLIIILIILIGGWYLLSPSDEASETPPAGNGETATTTGAMPVKPQDVTVTYTDSGFSPATVTVAQGSTVTWVNQSSHEMWVASGVHPTHTLYDGTDRQTHCATDYSGPTPFDECLPESPGTSYSFTFDEAGTWHYHNHVAASDTGTVIVAAPSNTGTSTDVQVR